MKQPSPSLSFGKFDLMCSQAPLTLCAPLHLSEPLCYAKNVAFGNFFLFQPGVLFIDLVAISMTAVMICHIKSKYTAVGRKEMVMFFYLFAIDMLLEFLLVSNLIPVASVAYPYIAAMHVAFISTTFWVLMLNGFVGFQWAEDGTPWSLWSFRISSGIIFVIAYCFTLATFLGFAGLSSNHTLPLFIIYYIFNGAALFIYILLQTILVLNTLEDLWPLGDILFGVLFFVASQVTLIATSQIICKMAVHYVDGMFFSSLFILLAVMMVYKYWDSITAEDLEFSLSTTSSQQLQAFQPSLSAEPLQDSKLTLSGMTLHDSQPSLLQHSTKKQ